MMRSKGFSLIELVICIAVVGIVGISIGMNFINNRGATEARAYDGAKAFTAANNIVVKRMNCSGDSDHDGYGTCTVVTDSGEKIQLNCNSDWMNVNVWGATGCKEVVFPIYGMPPGGG